MATRENALLKARKMVEKLNQYIKDAIKECDGEQDLYLDTSSTVEGAPEYVEPNYNIKADGHLYVGDVELCKAITSYDDEEDGEAVIEWCLDDELDEFLKFEKACVRRGVKYFQKYGAELDDDDEAREAFLESL